ncbi:PREDICTED: uncharacterized protein LOC104778076 [Camelina sativa]|uniref:Uncharacterized protein LOC104778076 n=1 Tax=Camelina sativa TaxID=90675 RepID=A0ABM0YH08_CAMSA|nr:PREDICTED: uncharacterized protein LOC104778076 [Camelina sativa]
MATLPPYDPKFKLAIAVFPKPETENDQLHDESVSAAIVAADLISSTRLKLKLDSVHTEYSAQYLVDNAAGSHGHKLTVKGCLEFALKNGIPKAEDWPQLGSVSKPPSSYKPALVTMKGKVVVPKNLEEVVDMLDLVVHQPLGAKLHVLNPHLELQGIYCGPTGEPASYVGLRDGIILGSGEDPRKGHCNSEDMAQAEVYNPESGYEQVVCAAVSGRRAGLFNIGPSYLLVDYCVPLLSID